MTPFSRTRENAVLIFFGLTGFILFLFLFPRVQHSASLNVEINHQEAIQIAEQYLLQNDKVSSTSQFTKRNTVFFADNRYKNYYKQINATDGERDLLETHSPPYYWKVLLLDPSNQERYLFKVDIKGKIFDYTFESSMDEPGARLLPRTAESIARSYLRQSMDINWALYSRIDANSVERDKRTDHTFTWRTNNPAVGDVRFALNATVSGDEVTSWSRTTEFPEEFDQRLTRHGLDRNVINLSNFVAALLLWIVALFIFAQRFRASEISVRNGLIVSFIFLTLNVLYYIDIYSVLENINVPTQNPENRFIAYFSIGTQVFFTALFLFFIWMAGETHSRDLWPKKLRAVDGLFARYFFFPDLGRAILRGFSLGLIQLGILYVLFSFAKEDPDVWFIVASTEAQYLSAQISSRLYIPLTPLLYAGIGAFLTTGYALLFSLSLLKKTLKSTLGAILVSWLFFAILFNDIQSVFPVWFASVCGVVISLFNYVYFYRYDLMTVIIGNFILLALPGVGLFLFQSDSALVTSGIVGIVLLFGLFLFGVVIRLRGTPLKEAKIVPEYARNISERQRLKLELDVARRAQLQMLPQSLPSVPGLDIAAFSEPAREVGGDYFDFFYSDEQHLGFAIGDVSGKGMPAALYMTLLKGAIQSQSTIHRSPKDLLRSINKTFFNAAERNTFVTLLYGTIDVESKVLRFARAGHNPILIHRPLKNDLIFLQPRGLGIGLEKGAIFDRVIEEECFSLQSGDTLIAYTDGLIEARNLRDEEFSQERLDALITAKAFASAEELLHRIKEGYLSFTGRAEPHDDLTCLVIKIQ